MRTIYVLIHNPPFVITRTVGGPKGWHWCRAAGRTGAEAVYRHIPWEAELNEDYIEVMPVAREFLADGAVFWIKPAEMPSKPRRIIGTAEVPAPDGYEQVAS
jgi:hypothetical protein